MLPGKSKQNREQWIVIHKQFKMKREEGYYWVKYRGDWIIAEYTHELRPKWYVIGNECPFHEREFSEINENRIINNLK